MQKTKALNLIFAPLETMLVVIFIIAYLGIAFESVLNINKAAIALLGAVLCWTVFIVSANGQHEALEAHLSAISSVLFFILGAMTIVELIDAHDGFDLITGRITHTNKRTLLWILSFLTFFLSSLLDNLTTTIVMISLLRKLVRNETDRLYFVGMIVIAANAGGAWSPIGDVTTTMLWIGGQITALNILGVLILPSLACLLVPLFIMSWRMKGKIENPEPEKRLRVYTTRSQAIVLASGLFVLALVPVFKVLIGLPPYMGMLGGLAILWIITELLHISSDEEEQRALSVAQALRRIDSASILFFLGILLCVSSLETAGILKELALWMGAKIGNNSIIVLSLGLVSAIIDNVPLVAAAQGMYSLSQYPADHYFWEFLSYSTGTGGSALIIGSAAGVAAMGMEKVSFAWYLKKISYLALLGYFAGALVYLVQMSLFK